MAGALRGLIFTFLLYVPCSENPHMVPLLDAAARYCEARGMNTSQVKYVARKLLPCS